MECNTNIQEIWLHSNMDGTYKKHITVKAKKYNTNNNISYVTIQNLSIVLPEITIHKTYENIMILCYFKDFKINLIIALNFTCKR